MINPQTFFSALKQNGINFFSGVPDSLLKDICAYITENTTSEQHIIAANEGGAVALATGYHLATGKIPLVYFQNSGLGNATNPLLSLASNGVYGIPMVLMIGWRGEPGIKDEPQHIVQGKVQNALLEDMGIPAMMLDETVDDVDAFVKSALDKANSFSGPVAIIVRKNTFEPYALNDGVQTLEMFREEALDIILSQLNDQDIVVSTTGKTSREVYEYRENHQQTHDNDFLTVGSMGHASQIALGISKYTKRRVFCIDGDGAVLMHMGSLAINGINGSDNFFHILINNGAHESVGGQPTLGFEVNFPKIAEACAYKKVMQVDKISDLQKSMKELLASRGPSLLEVRVKKGSRPDLGRPKETPVVNKAGFMKGLGN